MTEEVTGTEEAEGQNTEEEKPGLQISENTVILLLIVFTLVIGGWWFLNLYMGRWI